MTRTSLALLGSLLACTRGPVVDDLVQKKAHDYLHSVCTKARSASPPRSGSPDPASFDVTLAVESQTRQEGTWLSGIRFDVLVDKKPNPSLSFGSVGVGDSEKDAQITAVDEWAVLFVEPFCAATYDSRPAIAFQNLRAFQSAMGFRGSRSTDWPLSDMALHGEILSAAFASPPSLGSGGLTTLDLKIVITPGNPPQGECRLNGQPAPDHLARIAMIDWPKGHYMLKQFYVIVAR